MQGIFIAYRVPAKIVANFDEKSDANPTCEKPTKKRWSQFIIHGFALGPSLCLSSKQSFASFAVTALHPKRPGR